MLKTMVGDDHAQYEDVKVGQGRVIHMRKNDRIALNEKTKEVYFTCNQSLSSCFGGSETYIQFEVEPSGIDKIHDIFLYLNITNTLAAGNSTGTLLLPTFWFFNRCEIYCAGVHLFTKYPEPNLLETVIDKADNFFIINASALNVGSSLNTLSYSTPSTALTASTRNFFIPIMDEFEQSKIPISLCKKLIYKFYLPAGANIQTTTADTITLNNAQLYIKYSENDPLQTALLRRGHTKPKVFPIVDYDYFQKTYSSTTANTRIIEQLQNGKGSIAGLLFFHRRIGNAYTQSYNAITDMSILDDQNAPVGVRNYPMVLFTKDQSELFPDTRIFASLNLYFKSYCAHPEMTLKTSADTGSMDFSDNFKIEFNPSTTAYSSELVVYSYKYAYLTVYPNGNIEITREPTSS